MERLRARAQVNHDNARILSESLVRSVDDLTAIEAERDSLRAQRDAYRETLEKIKARADSGGRRLETAQSACDDIEAIVDAALATGTERKGNQTTGVDQDGEGPDERF